MVALIFESTAGLTLPVRILAVVGAFTVGGLLFAALFALLAKAAFGQKIPPKVAWVLRFLSGVACAWVAAYLLFSEGGGAGGPGGGSLGGNGNKGSSGPKDKPDKKSEDLPKPPKVDPETKEKPNPEGAGSGAGEILRVEILGDDVLRKVQKTETIDPQRRYRLADEPGKLWTQQEVRELISRRRKESPPLRRLEIITYSDSPATDAPVVKELQKWAQDLPDVGNGPFGVDMREPGGKTPLR